MEIKIGKWYRAIIQPNKPNIYRYILSDEGSQNKIITIRLDSNFFVPSKVNLTKFRMKLILIKNKIGELNKELVRKIFKNVNSYR